MGGGSAVAIRLQINIFVLHRSPQSLGKDVVHASSLSVHADLNVFSEQDVGVITARVLATLIAIVDCRGSNLERRFESLGAKISVERVRELPADDIPAEPIKYNSQIRPACFQFHVGNIRTPYMVWPRDGQILQQIRIFSVGGVGKAGMWLCFGINRRQAH